MNRRTSSCLGVAAIAACLAACAGHRDAALAAAPASGSPYVGWRVYNARCAACHGTDATGPAPVQGMLERVREMGAARFANLVLQRYDWPAAGDARGDADLRAALVEDILRHKEAAFEMPAWQDDPPVSAHILDLYAYLAARADGAVGTGRPAR